VTCDRVAVEGVAEIFWCRGRVDIPHRVPRPGRSGDVDQLRGVVVVDLSPFAIAPSEHVKVVEDDFVVDGSSGRGLEEGDQPDGVLPGVISGLRVGQSD